MVETSMWERNIHQLPLKRALTGVWTCNLGMCHDWELNPRLFGLWDDAPTKWAIPPRAEFEYFSRVLYNLGSVKQVNHSLLYNPCAFSLMLSPLSSTQIWHERDFTIPSKTALIKKNKTKPESHFRIRDKRKKLFVFCRGHPSVPLVFSPTEQLYQL